jgi:hypothetical protein
LTATEHRREDWRRRIDPRGKGSRGPSGLTAPEHRQEDERKGIDPRGVESHGLGGLTAPEKTPPGSRKSGTGATVASAPYDGRRSHRGAYRSCWISSPALSEPYGAGPSSPTEYGSLSEPYGAGPSSPTEYGSLSEPYGAGPSSPTEYGSPRDGRGKCLPVRKRDETHGGRKSGTSVGSAFARGLA